MVTLSEHYDAYPYPERDPSDEAKRLIIGSPSHPLEIDHHLFGGKRDWTKSLRALVAGGGTGDGLIQLATILTQAKRPFEITYLDLSTSARKIAEARAKARDLKGITFHTASLLDAADYGPFDYVDCCGVLHHLPEPEAGFRALRAALAPGGGMGFMVYAPYGRSGVYPLQDAFAALYKDQPPAARLDAAKALVANLPKGHPFATNPNLGDHHASDAGFYDLLLHSQDRSYSVRELTDTLSATGWHLTSFATPALYDLSRITKRPDGMDDVTAMEIAEKLTGTIRLHVAYATPKPMTPAKGSDRALVPHLKGVRPPALAQAVAKGKPLPIASDGVKTMATLDPQTAPLLAAIDGRRSLSEIAQATGLDPLRFGSLWAGVERNLAPWGLLLYSNLLR